MEKRKRWREWRMRCRVWVMCVCVVEREEETDELIETETEGQPWGFETYARQPERTGGAADGWEGRRGVTGGEGKMTTGWMGARDRRGGGCRRGQEGEITARSERAVSWGWRRRRRVEEGAFAWTGCHNGSRLLILTLWTHLTHAAGHGGRGGG